MKATETYKFTLWYACNTSDFYFTIPHPIVLINLMQNGKK